MAQADIPHEHLTEYERAVCYYALPRVMHPVTLGLIIAYAVCLLEGVVAVVLGIAWDNNTILTAGTYALGAMIIFGLVVFFIRALLDDIRKRRLLNEASHVPQAPVADLGLPDPFSNHLLLKRPSQTVSSVYACTEADATIQYIVQAEAEPGAWRIISPQDVEICRVKVLRGPGSFVFGQDLPREIGVYVQDREVARIVRKFSFETSVAVIEPRQNRLPRIAVRQRGLFLGDRLVGRIYHLRGCYYLDVEKLAFNEAVLAYFVTVT